MTSVTLHSAVDGDGTLLVKLPEAFHGAKVMIVVQTQDPLAVLQETAGSIPDLTRPSQGEGEKRLAL